MSPLTTIKTPATNLRTTALRPSCLLLLLVFCLQPDAYCQRGARTLPLGIDQLTQQADVIVHGYVTSAKIEPHPQLRNLKTILVTLSVKDTYKGKAQKSITFRQFIWDSLPERELTDYGKSQELVLFLGPVSEYGLSSPVGLEQGRFRVSTNPQKQMLAVNGRGNFGLFQALPARAQARGVTLSPRTLAAAQKNEARPLPLADLEEAIRTFAGAR